MVDMMINKDLNLVFILQYFKFKKMRSFALVYHKVRHLKLIMQIFYEKKSRKNENSCKVV